MPRIVLLFLHGGGFNKECLRPMIQRLQKSPLLQRVPCEVVSLDWRFHGEKSDHSVKAVVSYPDGDPTRPLYDHPLRVWFTWGLTDLQDEVNKIRAQDADTRVIGIGHSMGGSAMLRLEMDHPGTFDGIIAFEPVNDDGKTPDDMGKQFQDMIVKASSSRPGEWNSWEDVQNHFKKGKMYRRWHPESVEAFMEQGVRRRTDGRYVLAIAPHQEASIYSHKLSQFDFAKVKCKVHLLHGARSVFFNSHAIREKAAEFPGKVSVGDEIPNTTHAMVLEDPDTCAQRIVAFLEDQPLFQPQSKL